MMQFMLLIFLCVTLSLAARESETILTLDPPREYACASALHSRQGKPYIVVAGGETGTPTTALSELAVVDFLAKTHSTFPMSVALLFAASVCFAYTGARKVPRDDPSCGSVADLFLVAGGNDGTAVPRTNLHQTLEIFNVTAQAFLPELTLSTKRRGMAVACTLFACAFIGGQGEGSGGSKAVDVYDLASGALRSFDMVEDREYPAAVALGDQIFVLGGGLSGDERRFTIEQIDLSGEPIDWASRVVHTLDFSWFYAAAARSGSTVVFGTGQRRDKDKTGSAANLPRNVALLRTPDGMWKTTVFGGAGFSEDNVPRSDGQAVTMGEYAVFAGGSIDFVDSPSAHLFLFDAAKLMEASFGWTTSAAALPKATTNHALAALVHRGVGYVAAVAGNDDGGEHGSVHLISYTDDPALAPTCTNCEPGECVANNVCECAAGRMVRPEWRAGLKVFSRAQADGAFGCVPTPMAAQCVPATKPCGAAQQPTPVSPPLCACPSDATTPQNVAATTTAAIDTPSSSPSGGADNAGLIVGVVVGVLALLALVLIAVVVLRRRQQSAELGSSPYTPAPSKGHSDISLDQSMNSYTSFGYSGTDSYKAETTELQKPAF